MVAYFKVFLGTDVERLWKTHETLSKDGR